MTRYTFTAIIDPSLGPDSYIRLGILELAIGMTWKWEKEDSPHLLPKFADRLGANEDSVSRELDQLVNKVGYAYELVDSVSKITLDGDATVRNGKLHLNVEECKITQV